MPNNQIQQVELTPLSGGPGKNWTVGHNGHNGSDPNDYPVVNVPAKAGPYLIHFSINGPKSIKFDPSEPVTVKAGSKPGNGDSGWGDQIVAVLPSADGRELFVLDKNDGGPTSLYYKMKFVGHTELDPIINNGGSTITNNALLYYAGGFALLALVFALGLFMQKKFRLI